MVFLKKVSRICSTSAIKLAYIGHEWFFPKLILLHNFIETSRDSLSYGELEIPSRPMKIEIITIGDEILIGQTVDTNSAWMAHELNAQGVRINRIHTISDEAQEIISAMEDAFSRVDLVIMTGGLGPTNDDITKKTLSDYFQMPLVMHDEVLEEITAYFTSKNREMLQVNTDQALLPDGAIIIRNKKGTASGMWFERDGKVVVSMPGVPYEMEHLMKSGVLEMISKKFKAETVFHRSIMTFGEGESFIAERVKDWELSLAKEDIKLAYLPSQGIVKMRLSAFGDDDVAIKERVMRKADELELLIPELVYGYDDQSMEEVVAELLLKKKAKIGTAESCTGGYIAHLLTSIPGSSSFYEGSICTYSYRSKSEILDIDPQTIIEKGAVSAEVVEAMAQGVFLHFDVKYSIAVSGIAGPSGGTKDKPVGTVWMSVGTRDSMVTQRFQFGRDRMRNIRMTALHAINLVRLSILRS